MWQLVALLLVLTAPNAQSQEHSGEIVCNSYCRPAGELSIDLDLPPQQRWAEAATLYKAEIHEAIAMIAQFVPADLRRIAEDLSADLVSRIGDIGQEIVGVAKVAGIPIGDAVLLNIIYEVEAGCTSIITSDHSTGKILHGRNLDFNLAPILRNATVQVNFTRGGRVIFRGTTYAGYVGLLTGMRPGAFSISADQRQAGDKWENFAEALFVDNATAAAWLIRRTLDSEITFETALDQLAHHPIVAPIYLILGGLSAHNAQGAVITRDRNSAADVWRLDGADSKWYLVETNFDHWKPAGDNRRATAERAMAEVGSASMTADRLFGVMSTVPVMNGHTTYTAIMSAATDFFETQVRTY